VEADGAGRLRLTGRQRLSWLAHLYKAVVRQHHRELIPLLAPHVPVDAVVIDIGAHAGQFSKLFARMAPHGIVYAFEPSAYARSLMRPAVRMNGLANIRLIGAGLSDAEGEMVLRTPVKPSGSLGFGTAHLGGEEEEAAAFVDQRVALTTLDAFTATERLARLDLIKADVEGWEMRVLVGGEHTLRVLRPALFLEVDGDWMVRAGDTPNALFSWLGARGYHGCRAPDLRPAPTFLGPADYLFVGRPGALP
jgi:FkbM family methyltransferase